MLQYHICYFINLDGNMQYAKVCFANKRLTIRSFMMHKHRRSKCKNANKRLFSNGANEAHNIR